MPQPYLTAPIATDKMPPAVPYIIGNEAAERFSYYGMRAILVVFMTKYLLDSSGARATMSQADAKGVYHLFMSSVYFFPILGALIADLFWGKYRTIIYLSIVYCLGHLALSLDETRVGLYIGLTLIALGSGGIKPCVSANVGDQFGASNKHLLEKVFGWFYFSINFGSFFSTLLTPWLLQSMPQWLEAKAPGVANMWGGVDRIGPHVAFGVPGVLMLIATIVFWMGRHKYVHVPPKGWEAVKSVLPGEGGRILLRLVPIFLCVSIFWSLYDQTGSAWILQADHMDRHWLGHEWLSSQVHAANPLLILAFIPLFNYALYPALNRLFVLTPLRKVGIGLFLTALSFVMTAIIEQWIVAGETPSIGWQIFSYVIITAGEVLVSITCLEFSYTQAPKELKSFVMSMNLLSISLGNAVTALVNFFLQLIERGGYKLSGPNYYWFFTAMMFVVACGFIFIARRYRGETQLQDEAPAQ